MSAKLKFIKHLEKNGCYASVVSVDHAAELGEEVRSLNDKGLLDDELYRDYSALYFVPKMPRTLPNPRSIIVVAVPQPMLRTTFHWKGKALKFVVPPTYYDANKVNLRVRRLLTEGFEPDRYRFVRATLPVKLLAVRSGIALYGRNNITYDPGYGSFHRLTAFYSDFDSPVDNWREKKALPKCDACKACLKACPTGAIQKDRFLIRAERCLTYLNEKTSNHKFPGWVDPSAHNAIVGCMICQKACPYNKDVVDWCEDRGEFSEEETEYLLEGRFSGARAKRIGRKLRYVGLDMATFPRNLEALLAEAPPQ
jgi:epoxyqueuosine reductase